MNEIFMKRALKLSRRGEGFTSPNPCVGAVIVKGNKIVAEGWHKKAGSDHAEIVAIKSLMKKSGITYTELETELFRNAELYVTLEPCSHFGKTGPCAEAIVKAGFKSVFVGILDPSDKVNGKGVSYLKKAGIKVKVLSVKNPLAKAIRSVNQPFIKFSVFGLPYIALKAGMSLDGKIATASGESKWITSESERQFSRLERSKFDAVLVGSGTVKADDCELAAHGKWSNRFPLRVIIDRKLSCPLNKKVFRDENVFVATTEMATKGAQEKFKRAGVKFKSFGKNQINVRNLLSFLATKGIQSVFVEGGSSIHGLFYDAALKDKLVLDKLIFSIDPRIVGGEKAIPVVGGTGVDKLKNRLKFEDFKFDVTDDALRFTGLFNQF